MKRALLLLLMFLAVGCGSHDFEPGTATAAPLVASAREPHRGQLLPDGAGQPFQFDLELTRANGALTGQARLIAPDGMTAAYGPVSGTEQTFDIDFRPRFPLMRFQGAATAGSFLELAPGAQALGTGSFQTQRVEAEPPLSGRYTATLDDGTVVPLNLAPAGVDPQALPDVQIPPNPFLAYTTPFDTNELSLGGGLANSYFFNIDDNGAGFPFTICFFNGDSTGGTYTAIDENGSRQGKFTLTTGM